MFNPDDKDLVKKIFDNKVTHWDEVRDYPYLVTQVMSLYKEMCKEVPGSFIDFSSSKLEWFAVIEGKGGSEKVVGVLFYEYHSTFHVNGIYVLPSHRRKGIGASLMLEVICKGERVQAKFIPYKQTEGCVVDFLNYFGVDPILVHGNHHGYLVSRDILDRKIYLNSIDDLLEEAPFKCSFSENMDEVIIRGTDVTITLEQLEAIQTKIKMRKK